MIKGLCSQSIFIHNDYSYLFYNYSTYQIIMHSASSRFNGITLYTAMVLAAMCFVNFIHGRYIYEPKVDVNFEIKSLVNFVSTPQWEQASFKYNLNAGISAFMKIYLPYILGISNSSLYISSSNGMIPKQM